VGTARGMRESVDRSGPVSHHQTTVPHFPKMMQTKHWVSDSGKVPGFSNGPFNAS
jgi:hypothetical protein